MTMTNATPSRARGSFRPAAPRRPEGPIGALPFLFGMWRNPLATWSRQSFEIPFIQFTGIMGPMAVLNEPTAIKHVLVDNAANYRKDALQLRVLSPGLGDGLLTAEGDEWRAQRRALAPLFTPRMVDSFEPALIAGAEALAARWEPLREGRRVEVAGELSRATLDVLQRTIFPEGLARDPSVIAATMARFFNSIGQLHPFDVLGLPDWAPRLGKRDNSRELKFFSDTVRTLIEERRKTLPADDGRAPPRDLLGLLLTARDPQTGEALGEPQIGANILTFIAAGHETTAGGLTWALYLLSQRPDWRAEVEAEVDAVLAEGFGAPDTFDRLVKTRATFEEALRLYPPAASLSREAIAADTIGDRVIKAGETIIISPWVLHRHQTLWDRPDDFLPERFLPGRRETIDRFAYLPFGAGPRVCIGMGFAMREGIAILATLLRKFRLDLAPGHRVEPVQRITLRPKGGMPMMLTHRGKRAGTENALPG